MRRFLAALVSLLVAFNFVWVKPVFANIDNSLIRVALSSMGNPISVRFEVKGNYTIQESPSIVLENKEYRVELVNGSLILTDGLVSYPMGAKFTFVRSDGQLRVLNNAYGWINYLGNMEIRIVDGGIRFVNYMHLETYLYGVVPYEMSNSWPLEALKTQAVAARTYAMRNMRLSSYYDLYDTEYSQVYKGYNANTGNAIKAVNDTFGKILKFGNTFAGTFYSSSNGGRTEKSKNIFLEDLPYTVIKDDPFDIGNPLNSKAFWIVTYNKAIVDLGLQSRLKPYIKASLNARGYSTNDTDINIHSIKELIFNPQNESGRVVSGRIVVILDAKNKSNGQIDTIEATVALIQGNIRSILKLDSLLVNLEDEGDAYILRGGGFGHGVGMSQFGAQQMANQGFNYAQILEFYYPGTQLSLLNIQPPTDDPSRGDGGDRPDPTPIPTIAPTTAPTSKPFPRPTTPQPSGVPTPLPTTAPT
ncbi:MAG: SpoIID/LytB domain-containing protein, partial [Firmicutes bacterium]|nr:SpoIID/LytB domain-containing protein [Bacillota bacterium]